MNDMNTTNQQSDQSNGVTLQSLGITPLGTAQLPNSNSQSQTQQQGGNMPNQQVANTQQLNNTNQSQLATGDNGQGSYQQSASQVQGGQIPSSPVQSQSQGNQSSQSSQMNSGSQGMEQAGITPQGNSQLYGYQPSINPNNTVELSDLGMTKGSKGGSSVSNSGNYNSVGSNIVEGGVPTNSLQATQNSSVSVSDNQYTIVAVRYDGGSISAVQLNTGEVITAEQAVYLTDQGLIAGVHTGGTRGSSPHKTLVSNPDGDPTNNLSNLPRF